MINMKRPGIFKFTLKQKINIYGYLFTLPFIIGFIFFFLYPVIQSIVFSFSRLIITREGYRLEFIAWQNYNFALFINPEYIRTLGETVGGMINNVVAITIFSLFAAVLLNQQFRGRMLARAIFFLPVIMGSGVVLMMEQGNYSMQLLRESQAASGIFSRDILAGLLMQIRLPQGMLVYVIDILFNITRIINRSAIQILIFLAGLQSIPPSLYEAARVEGATGWESFWKITFPLLSPLILTNVVYTVVDFFTSPENQLVQLIRREAFGGAGYGVSTAMSFIYFITVSLILIIVISLISRTVFYQE